MKKETEINEFKFEKKLFKSEAVYLLHEIPALYLPYDV